MAGAKVADKSRNVDRDIKVAFTSADTEAQLAGFHHLHHLRGVPRAVALETAR